MDIVVFRPYELPVALGALRRIEPDPSPKQDRYLELLARLHGASIGASALPTPSPRETAAVVTHPRVRERLVQLGLVMSMVEGKITPGSLLGISELARALEVKERGIGTLRRVAAGHRRRVWVEVMGRTAGKIIVDAYRETNLIGAINITLAFALMFEDPKMRDRFARLEHAPKDSLGHTLWALCMRDGLHLPGERGGIPERGLFHDVGHILSGYDTDPAGEIRQSAFQAGFMRKGGFGHMLFGLINFHMGVRVAPISDARTGLFDVEQVMEALARGAACKVDLTNSEQFNFWAIAHLPVAQVRADFGVPPLGEALRPAA